MEGDPPWDRLSSISLRCVLGLAGTMFVRFSRKEYQKLKKPEDKSLVVLGKVKLSRPFALSGISEKSNPILMKWNKPVR